MDRAGDRRGTASGLRPAPPGIDADRYARDDDARSRESASASDGASEASEEGSVSPEDAELLAKLEAEAAADQSDRRARADVRPRCSRAWTRAPQAAARAVGVHPVEAQVSGGLRGSRDIIVYR